MLEISERKLAIIVLMGHELDRAEHELRAFLETMNEDEEASLVAVYWIGRGVFEAEELEEAIRTARTERRTPTADYLLGSPHVADHIESGAAALGLELSDDEDDLMRGI
ncbi:DUF3775 domain-containing protein [Pseudooceanicola sp.]|jgi:hypothetical protein|uniref:DUF3775 domain-containing protein n=1 Tax=Pseudooceanicola sp. TaxID=1914328 RepID=UPI0040580C3D